MEIRQCAFKQPAAAQGDDCCGAGRAYRNARIHWASVLRLLLSFGWWGSPGAPPPQANAGMQQWQVIAVALGAFVAMLAVLGAIALRVLVCQHAKSAPGSTDPEVGKWLVRA